MTEYEFQSHLIKCLDFIRFSNPVVTDEEFLRTCRVIGSMTPTQLMEATTLGGEPTEPTALTLTGTEARKQDSAMHQRRLEAFRRDAREMGERDRLAQESSVLLKKTECLPRPKQPPK